MKQLKFLIPTLLFCSVVFYGQAQKYTSRLHGYFKATSDTVLYNYFTFDGQGSVDIMGFNDGYYFQKDDTLIVFPDKSLFKFLVRDDTLIGVSDWVKAEEWMREKQTVPEVNYSDSLEADRMAGLLNDYYELTNSGRWSFLFNNDGSYEQALRKLCVEGLTKACLDYAGLKILSDIGMFPLDAGVAAQKRAADPVIINLLHAVIAKGDKNGYLVLGGYWGALGDLSEAKKVLETGLNNGCEKCGLTLITMELQYAAPPVPIRKRLAPLRKIKK